MPKGNGNGNVLHGPLLLGRPGERSRGRDRRAGLGELLAALAGEMAGDRSRPLRDAFEQALCRILRLRSAHIEPVSIARGVSGPVARDGGGLEFPLRSGAQVLRVVPDAAGLDAWEHQVLVAAADLGGLLLEIERRSGPSRGGASGVVSVNSGLVGSSRAMQLLRDRIARVAPSDAAVLIEGESGVGKELVARQVHETSRRARGPFIAVNCAALVESLLEAELFGIEDRTATGVRGRRGKFELASGGTLFLDEIADLSTAAQAKLLRALQDMFIERVGGRTAQRIDVRVIAATNRSLGALVQEGRFRLDLFYRLNCVEIRVPPLRARKTDVAELASLFIARYGEGRVRTVSAEAMEALIDYDWPGNVRELERVIQRAAALADTACIGLHDLPVGISARFEDVFQPALEKGESLRAFTARYVSLVLHRSKQNKREACRRLGISYHTLQGHLRKVSRPGRSGAADSPAACARAPSSADEEGSE